MLLKTIEESHYPFVSKIYKEGIDTGIATFETKVSDWNYWNKVHLSLGRIFIEQSGIMLGWAALSSVSQRPVYSGVAEVSVYVAKQARGKGIGKLLLEKLIQISEQHEIWTLQSSIMPENKASLQLHLSCGFREIGYREKIGQLNNQWFDNIIMERRSTIIGV